MPRPTLLPAIACAFVLAAAGALSAQPPSADEQARLLKEAHAALQQWRALYFQGKYREAVPLCEKMLELTRAAVGDEHLETAEARDSLGVLLKLQGDFPAARKQLESALAIRLKVVGEQHIDTATSRHNFGMLLFDLADYHAAREQFEKAIAVELKLLGENHRDTANSYDFLGNSLRELGDYPAARKYLEKGLEIRRKTVGELNDGTAWSYNNLGILFSVTGDYANARASHERALAIRRQKLGEERMETAASYNNLGNVLKDLGDLPGAKANFELGLAINRRVLGDGHPFTAKTFGSLANVLDDLGDHAGARAAYERGLAIQLRAFGEEHADTARSYINLGNIAFRQREFAAAQKHYERGFTIYGKVLGPDHFETAGARSHLGMTLLNLNDRAGARRQLETAATMQQRLLGDEHPSTAHAFHDLLILEALEGDWRAAADWVELERRGSRRMVARLLPTLGEREQLSYLGVDFRRYLSGAMSLVTKYAANRELVERGAEWLLNGKGVGQAALAERALLARESRDPKLAPIAAELVQVRESIARLSFSIPKGQDDERRRRLETLAAREAELALRLVRAGERDRAQDPWVETATVRRAIPAKSKLVDFVRFDLWTLGKPLPTSTEEHYLAFITPAAGEGEVQIVMFGNVKPIDDLIEAWRKAIAATASGGATKQAEIAERLAERLWKPLAPHLQTAEKIYLSADGPLWLAPWAALPAGDGRFLIEDHAFHLLISGRDLLTPPNAEPPRPSVIFANPDYDLSPQAAEEATKGVLRGDYKEPTGPATGGKSNLSRVARLPGTAAEAELVRGNLPRPDGAEPKVFLDLYALESVAKTLRRPQVALFSTHGFFLADQTTAAKDRAGAVDREESRAAPLTTAGKPLENPLVRCGLLFAGCNPRNEGKPGRGDDGVLTGMEVVGIDLRGTELVVLSACETGVGAVNTGEGVAGLRQAFQLAGARSVLATLWQIPDRDSALIMNDFFANLAAGESQAEALRKAQVARIQARREKFGAAEPFFWAAWTVTGN